MPNNRQQNTGETKRSELNQLRPAGQGQRKSAPLTEEDVLVEDDDFDSIPKRTNSSAIRLNPPVAGRRASRDFGIDTTRQQASIPRRTGQQPYSGIPETMQPRSGRSTYQDYAPPRKRFEGKNVHWLLYVGIGMVAALALWVSLSALLAWGTSTYNNMVYGYPRTFQTDAVVGHNDSKLHPSHFIAINLHGQVIVIELPGGNPAKSMDYIGPDLIATSDDLIPITLTFSDVNHNGKVDMIIHIQDREVIFCNDGTKFTACSTQ